MTNIDLLHLLLIKSHYLIKYIVLNQMFNEISFRNTIILNMQPM